MPPKPTVALIGAGYVGTALVHELQRRGRDCLAVVNTRRSAERLAAARVTCQRIDLDQTDYAIDLPDTCSLVYLVAPGRNTASDHRLRDLLSKVTAHVNAMLYVSTSGVYGDQQGRLVDERVPPAPQSTRARRRLDAETQFRSFAQQRNIPWVIARVPGIYGPGRLPLQSLRDARPIIRVNEAGPGNRIHRDDLALALTDALERAESQGISGHAPTVGDIYNLGDGNYMSSSQFALEVARLARLPAPPQISREAMKETASSLRWSFLAESRRLDSRKVLGILSRPLRYTNPLVGIQASLDAPEDPAA